MARGGMCGGMNPGNQKFIKGKNGTRITAKLSSTAKDIVCIEVT